MRNEVPFVRLNGERFVVMIIIIMIIYYHHYHFLPIRLPVRLRGLACQDQPTTHSYRRTHTHTNVAAQSIFY